MKIINQCGLLFLICLGGIFLSRLVPFPMPASVLSMLLLFVLLLVEAVPPETFKESEDFLLGNMAFFFIPSGVGILEHIDALRGDIPVLFAICFAAMLLTFVASAFTVVAATKAQRKFRSRFQGGS